MAANSRPDRRRRVARGIYAQPNGRYAVCVMVDGHPHFRTLSATTVSEARRQREPLQSFARTGELPVSPRLTFAEAAGRWLADFEAKVTAGERRHRTLDLYGSQLRLHLLPRLGRRRLASITPDDVVAVMRDLQADGLSPWTIKRISPRSAASSLSRFAGATSRRIPSIASSATSDRIHGAPTSASSPRQSSHDSSRPVRVGISRLLVTGAYTGMRLSEVLGLSWDDVDFAAGVIHVRHQLARGRRGVPPHRIPPKTRASVREIPLLPQLATVLRQQKRSSRFTGDFDYVFATAQGTAFLHHNVSKRMLRRAAANAGLDRDDRRLRSHDLRHTFASHLIIDIRLDVAQVTAILGHARTSMTLDTYTHLSEEARHGADIRTELAKSDLANLLDVTVVPPRRAGEHLRPTRAAAPRRLTNSAGNPLAAPRTALLRTAAT